MPTHPSGLGHPDASELLVISETPFCAEIPPARLVHPVTPAAVHYVRGNFDIPALGADHAISVDGLVETPFKLTVSELKALKQSGEAASVTFTMECAGNDRIKMQPRPAGEPWNTGAVSTAKWTGVPLKVLLDRAGVRPGAIEVLVEGADHGRKGDATGPLSYGRSLPLGALGPEVLLAYGMNDADVPALHGGPVRLVVPGWYGMASVKWVTRISVLDTPFSGYFQAQRYVYEYGDEVVPVTRTRVKSIVVAPADGSRVAAGADVLAWGWTWTGEGEVARVEVHGDSRGEWLAAELGAPAGAPLDAPVDATSKSSPADSSAAYAWRRWECRLRFDSPGEFVLRTRATDALGNVQPDVIRWNRLGYGNNAVRETRVQVD